MEKQFIHEEKEVRKVEQQSPSAVIVRPPSARVDDIEETEPLNTKATIEDFAHSWQSCGIFYSNDRKKLLRYDFSNDSSSFGTGAEIICDGAVKYRGKGRHLTKVSLSDGVVAIGANAFADNKLLTQITIPESVTTIGECAFFGCLSLRSVHIPRSLTSIGGGAFNGCRVTDFFSSSSRFVKADGLLVDIVEHKLIGCYDSGIETVYVPVSVTGIGPKALYGCPFIQRVYIPDTVTEIEDSAFYGCKSLRSVHIPNSVTSIGKFAFCGCSSLQSVNIPDTLTSIGGGAFSGCNVTNLITHSQRYVCLDGCLIDSATRTLISCFNSEKKSVTVPDVVTRIGMGAFYKCRSLHGIHIPDTVTEIGECAFYGCSSMQSIKIPFSVKSIGRWAFYGCSSLQSIHIPSHTRKRFEEQLPFEHKKLVEI